MKKIENQEDEFYRDLDKKGARRSCCTFQTMLIFFGVILILSSLLTFFLYREIKKINFSATKIYPSAISKQSFIDKLKLDKNQNPTFSIVVTAEELTSLAADGIRAFSLEINEAQIEIENSRTIVYGKLIKPLKSDIKIEAVPEVEKGKIKMSVEKVSAGKLTLPGMLNLEIEKALNKMMDENFSSLYENYQVEKVELRQDEMVISGKLI